MPPPPPAAPSAAITAIDAVRRAMRLPAGARVVVAMSGGVDSSVTAGLLAEAGYEVIGLTARLYDVTPESLQGQAARPGSCCAPEDARDARSVARALGIRHYVVDERERFHAEVIAPFTAAWQRGETPNPCVDCNRSLKFEHLVSRARDLGAQALATGHYARLEPAADGVELRRGRDPGKDQAYFLYPMSTETAAFLRFPLGDLTKTQVREHAARMGLAVATKRESMDICFVGREGTAAFVARTAGARAGTIVDGQGAVLARHDNLAAFTVGQRRGLPLSAPGPDGRPRYVLETRGDGTVVVGPRDGNRVERLSLLDYRHLSGPPLQAGRVLEVQVRHRGQPVGARVVRCEGSELELALVGELPGMARGQSAVLLDGDRVLGGGTVHQVTMRLSARTNEEQR